MTADTTVQAPSNEHGVLYTEASRLEENARHTLHEAREKAHDVGEKLTLTWSHVEHRGNPAFWPTRKKWLAYSTTCIVCFIVGINSTSITSAFIELQDTFHTSDKDFPVSYLPVTSWTLGASVAPLLILPLMEKYGFRWAYMTLYMVFHIFLIPQAFAKNFATLIITRFISGCCAGVLQNATDGVAADLWPDDRDRGWPVSCFILAFLAGPAFGPVFGGAIIHYLHWQWILYIELIIGAVVLIPLAVFLRETRGSIILLHHARSLRATTKTPYFTTDELDSSSTTSLLIESLLRPTQLLFTEPVVFFFTLWTAFCFGTVFMFTQSVYQVYSTLYNFSEYQTGLVQSAMVIGIIIGVPFCQYQDRLYARSAERNTEKPGYPIFEARLYLAIPASFLGLVGGYFIYGFTSSASISWIAPTIGMALVGAGIMVVTQAAGNYMTDSYGNFASSAVAAEAAGENLVAALLPLATNKMYDQLGFRWASFCLGCLAIGLSIAPVMLLWKGRTLRRRSRFMQSL